MKRRVPLAAGAMTAPSEGDAAAYNVVSDLLGREPRESLRDACERADADGPASLAARLILAMPEGTPSREQWEILRGVAACVVASGAS